MNVEQHSQQRPVVGGIYRDKSGNSVAVVNVVGDKVLLEYADGTVTSIAARNWPQLHLQIAVY